MIDVIYLTGGQGYRAGLGYPKQYYLLGGKPMLVHGLEILRKINEIGKIIIPCEDNCKIKEICNNYNIENITTCYPGKTRQLSVFYGLGWITTDYVLIMEAVRPFVTIELIKKVIDTEGDAVTPIKMAISTPVSIVEVGKDKTAFTLERENTGEVQMPQKFKKELLLNAHRKAIKNAKKEGEWRISNSDDVALLVTELGIHSKCIDGIEENIKVTSPLDLVIANAIYYSLIGKEMESE